MLFLFENFVYLSMNSFQTILKSSLSAEWRQTGVITWVQQETRRVQEAFSLKRLKLDDFKEVDVIFDDV